jgi:hypothetical protein
VARRRRRIVALAAFALLLTLLLRSVEAADGELRQTSTSRALAPVTSTSSTPPRPDPQAYEAVLPRPPTTLPAPAPALPRPPTRAGVVLVVGDSIADFTAQSMGEMAAGAGATVIDGAVWGCGVAQGGPFSYFGAVRPQPPNCDDWPQRWQTAVDRERPAVVMLMVGRWEVMDRAIAGGWSHIGLPPFDDYLTQRLEQAVMILASRGARVVITTSPYFRRGVRPDGSVYPEDEQWRVDRFNELVRAEAARHPDVVSVADFGGLLSPGAQFTFDVNGMKVRRDGVHLTPEGSRWAAGWLLPQLLAAAPAP